ncbi:MAG: aminoglycoside phosphotransferase family protein [Gammaproteobacteria bacterium]
MSLPAAWAEPYSRRLRDDAALPGLAQALDSAAIAPRLGDALFTSRAERARYRVQACRIVKARYKPGRSCVLCYELTLEDRLARVLKRHCVSARLFPGDGSHGEFAKARERPLAAPPCGKALVHCADLGMVAWAFPNDRKLRGLDELTNAANLRARLLPSALAASYGAVWRIGEAAVEVINFVPNRSCTARVNVRLQHRQSHAIKPLVLYGKIYAAEDSEAAYRIMRTLWDSPAHRDARLRVAQPLGHDHERRLVWQRGVRGQRLIDQDMRAPRFRVLLQGAARVLAALHGTAIAGLETVDPTELIAQAATQSALLATVFPELGRRLAALDQRFAAWAARLPQQALVTLHNDLHLKNFIVDGTAVTLIDVDSVRRGPPLHDVGSLFAYLRYRGLLLGLPTPWLEELEAAFLEAYCAASPWLLPAQDVRAYTAVALIGQRAARALTRLKDSSACPIEALIGLAERLAPRLARTHGCPSAGVDMPSPRAAI